MDADRNTNEDLEQRKALVKSKSAKDKKFSVNYNYRLTQDFEVPDWIQDSCKERPQADVAEFGLGKRKRNEVTYKDQLSENEFLKIIEAGGDPQQEIEKRKRRKIDDVPEQIMECDEEMEAESYDQEGASEEF